MHVYSSASSRYNAGMRTVEGNIGTTAATGTTPNTATTGFFRLRQAISLAL